MGAPVFAGGRSSAWHPPGQEARRPQRSARGPETLGFLAASADPDHQHRWPVPSW